MHYYQFNIADYRKDTQHLSPMEHYIYRELMDWYYLDEAPIPNGNQKVLRKLRLVLDFEENLQNVLEEFFVLGEVDGESVWFHGRIDTEIARYKDKLETLKANGRKGGRPRKHPEVKTQNQKVNSEKQTKSKSKANQEPITNNQYKEKDKKEIADRVIGFLNQCAETRYRLTDTNRGLVIARINDGFTEQDCFQVITNRCERWLGTEQEQYIRPDTLFRPTKFESYLNDKGVKNEKRPTGNPATPGRKLTPAERTEAKRQEALRRESTGQPPIVGVVETHGGNVRPYLGKPAG